MKTFSFQQYYLKGCILSLLFFLVFLIIAIVALMVFLKTYKKLPCYTFLKRFFMLFLPIMVMVFGIMFAMLTGQTLKYGIHMIGEEQSDAISGMGKVEAIELLIFSPQYTLEGEADFQSAEVKLDGTRYYFMCVQDLSLNDTIQFQYLPKSKMILSYQTISDEEYSNWRASVYESDDTNETMVDPLFAIFFTGVMLLFSVFAKSQYLDRKLEQKIFFDDEKWDINEVRFHSSYLKQAIAFSVILLTTGGVFGFLFQNWGVLILLLFVIVGGLTISVNQYKGWRLTYNDHELILYTGMGRKEIIPVSNIVSINEKIENMFLSRGRVYSIVTIKYHYPFLKKSIVQSIKLDFRYQIGIRRFINFFNHK